MKTYIVFVYNVLLENKNLGVYLNKEKN